MHILSVLLITGLLVSGCASIEQFQRKMDSYIGWDVDQLREQFGYNYIEHDLGEKRRALTWTWTSSSLYPGHQTPDVIHTYQSAQGTTHSVVVPGNYYPPEYYEYVCEFSFIIDAQGRAMSWRAQGNGCASYPGPGPVLRHQTGSNAKP